MKINELVFLLKPRARKLAAAALVLSLAITCLAPQIPGGEMRSTARAATIWQPTPAAPIHWQWQIGSTFSTADILPGVTVYDLDLFDTPASIVAELHNRGCIVIAYVSFGTYESWRPDASKFPSSILGNSNGWPGEKWLDIRSATVRTIMAGRLDLAKSKGFDAVEPDNIDGYSNSTGFPLTYQDQLDYNIWIANQCHSRGLSVGLKNDIEQASALQPYFDWMLAEEAYEYNEYQALTVFTGNNKAVFEVEYSGTAQFAKLNSLHINTMTRDIDLVGPREDGYVRLPGIPDGQDTWSAGTSGTPDFALGISPSSQAVYPGGRASYTVTVSKLNGFSGSVSLSTAGLPGGVTASFSANPASTTSTLTLSTTATSAPGSYTIQITGTSGALTHTASAVLVIGANNVVSNALSVKVSTDSTNYSGGDTVTATVSITCSGAPVGGARVSLTVVDPWGEVISSQSATLTGTSASFYIKLQRRAPAGTYKVTASASASGYQTGSGASTFSVVSWSRYR